MTQFLFDIQIFLTLAILELIQSVDQVTYIAGRALSLADATIGQGGRNRFAKWFLSINQRKGGRALGLSLAVVLRILVILGAQWVMDYSWVRLFGATYLIITGLAHLGMPDRKDEGKIHKGASTPNSFWVTVLLIGVTDAVFAIDNVITSVAFTTETLIIIASGVFGILTMFVGSGWVMKVMEKEPRFNYLAFILILEIGVLLLVDTIGIHVTEVTKLIVTLGTMAVVAVYIKNKIINGIFQGLAHSLGQCLGNVFELVYYPYKGVTSLLKFNGTGMKKNAIDFVFAIFELFESLFSVGMNIFRIPKRIRLLTVVAQPDELPAD